MFSQVAVVVAWLDVRLPAALVGALVRPLSRVLFFFFPSKTRFKKEKKKFVSCACLCMILPCACGT